MRDEYRSGNPSRLPAFWPSGQLRSLIDRLHGLEHEQLHTDVTAAEGQCRRPEASSGAGGPPLACEPSDLGDALAGLENEIAHILRAQRALGLPADGISGAYRDGRWRLSLLVGD